MRASVQVTQIVNLLKEGHRAVNHGGDKMKIAGRMFYSRHVKAAKIILKELKRSHQVNTKTDG